MECTDHGDAKNDIAMAGPRARMCGRGPQTGFSFGTDGMRVVLTIN